MFEDQPSNPPSSMNESIPANQSSSGGNEPEISFPDNHPFWQAAPEAQFNFLQNKRAEARFDRELEGFIQELNRQYTTPFPAIGRDAIEGIAWTMIRENPEAYQALSENRGVGEIVRHYCEQAKAIIDKIVHDGDAFK